jgi:hypothetical protein
MQNKVEAIMRPYLEHATKQNTSMRFWKIGAFMTQPFPKSQYERWNNQLHTACGEEVMKRQANDHPMSMIMASEKFEFSYQNPLDMNDDGNDKDDDDGNEDDDDK